MKTPSLENAKNVFRKKFTDKTGNHWQGNASKTFKEFRKVPGKYQLIELDFSPDEENKKVLDAHEPNQIKMPDSTLHPKVLGIVELIFDINMMTSLMMEIGYDAKKMPLGKLSKTMIKSGFSILKQIESILNGKSTDRTQKLKTLTSEFYTIIPHDFGFKKMGAFVIDTAPKLKEKLHMVESLGEIEIAQKILKEEDIPDKHPADQHYEKLKTELKFIELDSEEFDMIRKYLENTHGCTHTCWRVRLTNLFRVDRQGEVERFSKSPGRENRMLLWHGSRLTNYVGILSQGLRIAPPEAPCTGYMFDKGVYFADTSSKSAQYCFPSHTNVRQLMMLCEVALGSLNEKTSACYDAAKEVGKDKPCLSTLGVGNYRPDPKETLTIDDVKIPLGLSQASGLGNGNLLYNEFIVYDTTQALIKYLLEVEFVYK
eukprot:GHVR01028522.1.p1 GENE.GHVR01028522.1~~GHVR01028522.1.p1  ORF type:complete len:428 (+),score=68.48 GHVR01028522.1:122-1405(+)